MLGKIFVKDFHIDAKVGHLIHERQVTQPILLNIAVWAPVEKAIESGDLADTVDYCVIRDEILELVKTREYILIETLASDILDLSMKDSRIEKAWIRLEKPNKFPGVASVGIELEKTK